MRGGWAITTRNRILISAGVVVATGAILLAMGRLFWCKCGSLKLFHTQVISPENSQHLFDFYAFTHIVHGFGFYALLWIVGRNKLSAGARALIALLLESGWEILENTDWVINRYRDVTISLDYYGDSVVNVVGDILAMVAGYELAARAPVWVTVALAIILEVGLALWIRDNLTLNVLMLLYPSEAIKAWQSGAQ